ncbi:hypothetical protein [Streptococcus mutans]|uniref:hypothetical protein n=1 Tax=Streptococcus mutans TaxID=1309 RepID=UPI0002B527A3|nr:hypothetical protein [Streptococcus mutans]EMB62182.1 hypothetical protein SMU21_06151 [Streptococcus mutans 1SM1]MCB5138594.1 hypothetical protein [Streptococcus mutans]MDT9501973.1 hypothetical protein [Streptococcus mutans]
MYHNKLVNWLRTVENINARLLLLFMGDLSGLTNDELKYIDMVFPEILVELDDKDTIVKQFKVELMKELNEIDTTKSTDFIFTYLKKKLKGSVLDNRTEFKINYSLLNHQLKMDDLYWLFYLSCYSQQSHEDKSCFCNILGSYAVFFARQYQLRELALCIIIATNYPEFFPKMFYRDSWNFLISNQTQEGNFGYSDPFVSEVKTDKEKLLDSFYSYYALSELKKL